MGTRFFRHWRVVSSISAAGVQPQVHKPPGKLIRLGHLLGLDLALQEVQQVLVGRLGHDLVLRLGLVLVLVLLEVLVVATNLSDAKLAISEPSDHANRSCTCLH